MGEGLSRPPPSPPPPSPPPRSPRASPAPASWIRSSVPPTRQASPMPVILRLQALPINRRYIADKLPITRRTSLASRGPPPPAGSPRSWSIGGSSGFGPGGGAFASAARGRGVSATTARDAIDLHQGPGRGGGDDAAGVPGGLGHGDLSCLGGNGSCRGERAAARREGSWQPSAPYVEWYASF